jgi:glutathione synthase/RimK-type ligase-like ATP-grasp enzyme/ribosomal protein S18 acetylase RimI-like enzyme
MTSVRVATQEDTDFLWQLEKNSFNPKQRVSLKSIERSILSNHQIVWILEDEGKFKGSATIMITKHTIRLYSIAILNDEQKKGYGKTLMLFLIAEAKQLKKRYCLLEADAKNIALIKWYESFGFEILKEYSDYYGENHPAFRMRLKLNSEEENFKTRNIVVIEDKPSWLMKIETIELVYAKDYIELEIYKETKGIRVFNLCPTYQYQSMGYYVSLLAAARNQRVIPNVTMISDFSDYNMVEFIGEEIQPVIERRFRNLKETTYVLRCLFGYTAYKEDQKLSKILLKLFETPMYECVFEKRKTWDIVKIVPLTLNEIEVTEEIKLAAMSYFGQRRFAVSAFKDYKYDLAILIDPNEKTPPSNKVALAKFKKAADQIGFYTEFITKEDYHRMSEFDALFIRTTTNVNDYTYRFSRYAYAEGLIVIDDPWSIMKCSNKLFFHESMEKMGVLTPKSMIVSKNTNIDKMIQEIGLPMVLKEPDNAFSKGVFKALDRSNLETLLNQMFESSDLMIAQTFLPSAFDWRIGIIDHKPLFACKYLMAKNHWQIYNWQASNQRKREGGVETLSIEEVPKAVVSTALKAASAMGDGFYGVDLKEVDGKVYVIEVNDNPNVDYRYEDLVLEDHLYLTILEVFMRRIEQARTKKRYVSKEKVMKGKG